MHLGKDEIEELPEGRIFWHAFVPMDEVMAATECRKQHLSISTPQAGVGHDRAATLRFFSQWPIGIRLENRTETEFSLTEEEEIKAIGPEAVLTGRNCNHELLQLFEILRRLLMVT
jgi:hypothetical protein